LPSRATRAIIFSGPLADFYKITLLWQARKLHRLMQEESYID
jgi:hypothetical protein